MPIGNRENEINTKFTTDDRELLRSASLFKRIEKAGRESGSEIRRVWGRLTGQIRKADDEVRKARRGFTLLRGTLASLAGNIGSNLVFWFTRFNISIGFCWCRSR